MLITPIESKVVVGSSNIGEVELTSYKYIRVEEAKFIEETNAKLDSIKESIIDYAKKKVVLFSKHETLKHIKYGDVVDAFYNNTEDSLEIKQILVNEDREEFKKTLDKIQKVVDIVECLNAYTMLLFRTTDDISSKIKELKIDSLKKPGEVCTLPLFIELLYFYSCEESGKEYKYLENRLEQNQNFI